MPYRIRIIDRGVDCCDPVCRHRFRFPDLSLFFTLRAIKAAIFICKPSPSNPWLFWKKLGFSPQKRKGSSLRGTPKILGKGRKNAQIKRGKSQNKKSKENEKSQEIKEGQGSVIFRDPSKIPYKTGTTWTFARLVLPCKVILALQGKSKKVTRDDA